jgi:hypothetical protein
MIKLLWRTSAKAIPSDLWLKRDHLVLSLTNHITRFLTNKNRQNLPMTIVLGVNPTRSGVIKIFICRFIRTHTALTANLPISFNITMAEIPSCEFTVADVSKWLNSNGFEDFSAKFQGMFVFHFLYKFCICPLCLPWYIGHRHLFLFVYVFQLLSVLELN